MKKLWTNYTPKEHLEAMLAEARRCLSVTDYDNYDARVYWQETIEQLEDKLEMMDD